eukprot:15472600-Alexandrium_andersonii.AAC.1
MPQSIRFLQAPEHDTRAQGMSSARLLCRKGHHHMVRATGSDARFQHAKPSLRMPGASETRALRRKGCLWNICALLVEEGNGGRGRP